MTTERDTAAQPPDGAVVMAPAHDSDDGPEDWRAGLPDELRRVAGKFSTPAEALRSYAALEKRLGRSLVVPADDAPAEEIAAFHARLGRPDSPDGYGIAPAADAAPEDAARLGGFLKAMHEAGATPGTVRAAVDWYAAMQDEVRDARDRGLADAAREADLTLRRDWGADYDRHVASARRAVRRFGDAALAETLDEAGLGAHPAVLKAFARIGAALGEGALLTGGGGDGAADAQSRIDALVARHFGKSSYQSAAVQGELRRLYQDLYGADSAPST